MQLRNQNSQNLFQQINEFKEMICRNGESPETIFNNLVKSGKFSSKQIEEAKKWADSQMSLFGNNRL